MKLDTILPSIFGLALVVGAYAAQAHHPQTTTPGSDEPAATANANTVPLSWVPDWLMQPLLRALADARDPRERHH